MTHDNTTGSFKMSETEIKNAPFITAKGEPKFYTLLRKKFALPTQNVKAIDCRKILISNNIFESWDAYAKNNHISKSDFTLAFVMNGPKVDDTLPDNTVVIKDGCFTYE